MLDLSRQIALPTAVEAMSYSLEMSKLPTDFEGLWSHLVRVLSASLRSFHAASGAEAMVWMDLTEWMNRRKQPALLLAVYICTDARASKRDLASLEPALAGSGLKWAVDGVMRRPRSARPVLVTVGGRAAQIWIDRRGRQVAYGIVMGRGAERIGWRTHVRAEATEADFIPELTHVIGHLSVADPEQRRRIERMKLVFAHAVAHRIMLADGVLEHGEETFLLTRFPEERLVQLGLGPEVREKALAEAEAELSSLLGHHEKLALLSTFYAACYADGRIEVRELRVLKEAATVLGLEPVDVSGYLQRLW